MAGIKHNKRIYVCHTFYHVFITCLKELNLPKEEYGNATLVLSKMSNDFGTLKERIEKCGLFESVVEFDEKRDTDFPELAKYRTDKGNIAVNMLNRVIFTKKFAKLEAPFVPVDFRQYDDIYVFCDADPIGLYLNQNCIKYHAVEDGLNYLKKYVLAKYTNRGHFGIKKFFSMNLNLIFMSDGYSKYCMDMEVNDISCIDDDFYKYVEVPRKELMESLDADARKTIISVFVEDFSSLESFISKNDKNGILILTEPLCELDVREKIFRDLTDTYGKEGTIFIKPHPRDLLDYNRLFSEYWIFDKTIPMEVLEMFDDIHFKKVVSVYTPLDLMKFADEKITLGNDFMDKYEDPSVHRKAEAIKEAFKN
ncbi:MAG: lipooligosaccharide sialyltransferase [Lachnospiraceae bacterium]|nr:lipooligosaccharide sialyltransferase [Lachnospiraceae bacterium]